MKTLAECMTAALQRSWVEKKARAGVDASAGSLGNSETGHKAGITNPKIHTLPVLTKRGMGSCTRYGSNFFNPRGTGAVVCVTTLMRREGLLRPPAAKDGSDPLADCPAHAAANEFYGLSVTSAAGQIKRSARDTGGDSIARWRLNDGGVVLCEPLELDGI